MLINWLLSNTPLLYLVQSLWRDEVFSIMVAQRPIIEYFTKLSFEPPLYYIFLHLWIRLFGTGEIAARSLSLTGVVLSAILLIKWSETLFKRSAISVILPILYIFNPMILYYAFEVRTYGWYIFFALLSIYSYISRRYRLLIFANICGFYTHAFFIFIPFVQSIHWFILGVLKHRKVSFSQLSRLTANTFVRAMTLTFVGMLPWLMRIIVLSGKLKDSWYFPVDIHLVKSVLGNMFISYEGTPWYGWMYTAYLSLFLLIVFAVAWIRKSNRHIVGYFLLNVFIPLSIIIGISLFKPMFVNRYLIFVTISEVFLIAYALSTIRNTRIQLSVAAIFILSCIAFNIWYPPKHAKFPWRDVIQEANGMRQSHDVIYASNSLHFFETLYYAKNKNGVYLYNPTGAQFPWYIGDAVFSAKYFAYDIPTYPSRAIIVDSKGQITIRYKTYLNTGSTVNVSVKKN